MGREEGGYDREIWVEMGRESYAGRWVDREMGREHVLLKTTG